MKRFVSFILSALALMLYATAVSADTELQLVQFTTADGLPNNTVRHIMQDSRGCIWISTSNGLSCYDGKEFHNYYPIRNSTEVCLKDQRIHKSCEEDGCIWVSTAKGISCFDLRLHRFVNYARKGLKVPDLSKDTIQRTISIQGKTWRVTEDDGLYIVNNKTGESEHFTTTSRNNTLPTNALKCIFQDRDGLVWIGTDNLGISHIKVVQNEGVDYLLEGENIRMLSLLDKDRIAVGNRSGETWIYDASLKRRLSTTKREKSTYCILQDKEGNRWEGTKGAHLYVNGEQKSDSIFKDIYALLQDRRGNIWIGTFGAGLICTSPSGRQGQGSLCWGQTRYLTEDNGNNRIRSLVEADNGDIWIGTSNGVYVLDAKQKGTPIKAHLCVENGKLYSNEIRTLFKDSRGDIFIAEAGEGFAILNASDFTKDSSISPRHFTAKDSLVNTMVQSFVEDREGFIWIATEFGISKLNRSTNLLRSYYFSKNMINNVYSENCGIRLPDGRIAFGTNNGIVLIDPAIYNKGEKTTGINVEDVTINGQAKGDTVYVVRKWWKSTWALVCYAALLVFAIIVGRRIKRNNSRFHRTIKELNVKTDQLVSEKEQLHAEKEQLHAEKEQLSAEKEEIEEHYATEVRIKREGERSAQDEEFIRRVEAITSANMSKADFTSDGFAAEMGMGRTVFFNRMKKVTGYSPKEYLKLKRLKRAAELIATTDNPIGEISFGVGIEDPLYFSRVFKQTYGMSPTEWRRMERTK